MMIITTNTTWTAGQTYNLNEEVQIAPGATLTIEAGANVVGGTFRVYGELNVTGTADQKVDFKNTNFLFGGDYKTPGSIHIENANMEGGSFLDATGNASYGKFNVQDSLMDGVEGFYIWYPTGPSSFERNVFVNSDGLSVGVNSNATVLIENNVFYPAERTYNGGSSIVVWAAYGGLDSVVVSKNSFLGGGYAIEVADGYSSAQLLAIQNYFGTTDLAEIAARIWDRSDSLTRNSYIDILSFLTEPDPSTPQFEVRGPIKGTENADIIKGTVDDDEIFGLGGNDVIYGFGDDDKINGGRGDDILIGGAGADILTGTIGNDTASYETAKSGLVVVMDNPSKNTGDAKGDTYYSVENVTGSRFADKITGDYIANRLDGGKGNDTLDGAYGKDTLIGGLGADRLKGGESADKFVFTNIKDSTVAAVGRDTILDFSHSSKDRIDVSEIDANAKLAGNQAFTFVGKDSFHGIAGELRFEQKKGGTYVYADVNGDKKADFSILLDGPISLIKGDFVL